MSQHPDHAMTPADMQRCIEACLECHARCAEVCRRCADVCERMASAAA